MEELTSREWVNSVVLLFRPMEPLDLDPEPEFIEPDPGTPDQFVDDFQYPVIGTCRALYPFDGRYLTGLQIRLHN